MSEAVNGTPKDDPRLVWQRPWVWLSAPEIGLRHSTFWKEMQPWNRHMCWLIAGRANLSKNIVRYTHGRHVYDMRHGEWIATLAEIAKEVLGQKGNVARNRVLRSLQKVEDRGWLTVVALEDKNDGMRMSLRVPVNMRHPFEAVSGQNCDTSSTPPEETVRGCHERDTPYSEESRSSRAKSRVGGVTRETPKATPSETPEETPPPQNVTPEETPEETPPRKTKPALIAGAKVVLAGSSETPAEVSRVTPYLDRLLVKGADEDRSSTDRPPDVVVPDPCSGSSSLGSVGSCSVQVVGSSISKKAFDPANPKNYKINDPPLEPGDQFRPCVTEIPKHHVVTKEELEQARERRKRRPGYETPWEKATREEQEAAKKFLEGMDEKTRENWEKITAQGAEAMKRCDAEAIKRLKREKRVVV